MQERPRIGIVCLKPVCLAGLQALIARSQKFDVVATSVVPREVFELVTAKKPDIVLFEFDGHDELLKLLAAATALHRRTKFLIIAGTVDADRIVHMLDIGAMGCLSLSCSEEELFEALQQIADGNTYISPGLASRVIGAMRRNTAQAYNLNAREEQIVRILCQGKTNREIARTLGLREKTIKHYMSQLMLKMQVRNRLEVVMTMQSTAPAATRVN